MSPPSLPSRVGTADQIARYDQVRRKVRIQRGVVPNEVWSTVENLADERNRPLRAASPVLDLGETQNALSLGTGVS